MNKTLEKQLIKYAKSDLKIAKVEGMMTICETKIGNINITFDRVDQLYVLNGLYLTEEQAVKMIVENFVIVEEA